MNKELYYKINDCPICGEKLEEELLHVSYYNKYCLNCRFRLANDFCSFIINSIEINIDSTFNNIIIYFRKTGKEYYYKFIFTPDFSDLKRLENKIYTIINFH